MANKSGTSSQVISLPTGGGALTGLGESFSPDLFTGTGNFAVPVAMPPGRNGLQPHLTLAYSTGSGNGPFGLGWSLAIPGVSRRVSKGVPRYSDGTDVFLFSNAEDLVPVESVGARTHYRPRTEGLFARIAHHRDNSSDYWEVRNKDGLISRYGTVGMAGNDPAAIADPSNRHKVFAWKLTSTRDSFGNAIEYDYVRDTGDDRSHLWDQLYLNSIRYVEYENEPGSKEFLVSAQFDYVDRPDPFSEYRSGFEVRTRKRCSRIRVFTEQLRRTHALVYLDECVAAGASPESDLPMNRASLLSEIRVTGHNDGRTEALPPLEMGYTKFEPARRRFQAVTAAGNSIPERSLAHAEYEMVDLFGNGLPSIVQIAGATRFWRNLGGGVFDVPRTMEDAPAGIQLSAAGVQMADMSGDGRADLLVTDGVRGGYFPLTFGKGWKRDGFVRYDLTPSINLEAPDVRLIDIDGDGVVDAMRSGIRFELYANDPRRGWTGVEVRDRTSAEGFPDVNFSDPRVKLGDMTGDDLQDIVFVCNGRIDYWPYLGHGRWGRRITMRNSPVFENHAFPGIGFDPRRVLLADVDGDGVDDILYVGSGITTLWINQSGNGWSAPLVIQGTPLITDVDAVRPVDLLGTGTRGVLWSYDRQRQRDSTYKFLDFTGGIKPYLLHEIDNHAGAATRIMYAPSTRFYLEDEKRPATRWKTPLPFPVQVVASVEVIDHFSGGKLTSEYSYHHGYWDGHEREFRGFGRVDERDTETFERYHHPREGSSAFASVPEARFSPALETRTWFHQGAIEDEGGLPAAPNLTSEFHSADRNMLDGLDPSAPLLETLPLRARRDALRAMRGRIVRTELYAHGGTPHETRPFVVNEYLTSVREEGSPGLDESSRRRVFFPHTVGERVTRWEGGDDPMTSLTFSDDYDEVGQPRRHTVVACPRGWRRLTDTSPEPFLATISETLFARPVDPAVYLMDRTARFTTFELQNDGRETVLELMKIGRASPRLSLVSESLTFYDGEPFVGRSLGEVGAHGAVMRVEGLVLTDDILRDAYQNSASALDPLEVPPYLVLGARPQASGEYPGSFLDQLAPLAGYLFRPGGPESARGLYVATARHRYDFQAHPSGEGRGLRTMSRDSFGAVTTIEHDRFGLFPIRVTDPVGMTTSATYDIRVFAPLEVTDANDNRVRYAYTPLGFLESVALLGKRDEEGGDVSDVPSTRYVYDFLAFDQGAEGSRQPMSVRTIQRVHHIKDGQAPLADRDETITTVEFSDGFGRRLQTRTQAEDVTFGDATRGADVLPSDLAVRPGDALGRTRAATEAPAVVVSGWQTYDNKGRVVEKFEPFVSSGFAYIAPRETELGQKARMFYDARGQMIRTVNANGSENRVIAGVPGAIAHPNLDNPDVFEPTPWEAYTYDESDNAGRTHGLDTSASADTPVSVVTDALGRVVARVERNGRDPDRDWLTTRSTYDIRGLLLSVTDPLGRRAFRYTYDLAGNVLRTDTIDAGVRQRVLDAAGNEIERRHPNGARRLGAYDALQRPVHVWARDTADTPFTVRERLVYGDSPDATVSRDEARTANLLGRLFEHYDESGLLTRERYDFKGNGLEKLRRVITDERVLERFSSGVLGLIAPFRVDWQPPEGIPFAEHAGAMLGAAVYRCSATFDALNRTRTFRYPMDVAGERKELRPRYNRAGKLERVLVGDDVFVDRVAYNAKGQRTLIAYGNGVMTRYAYDEPTFRLVRLRSEPCAKPDASGVTYRATGTALQDYGYSHDLAGNIVAVRDRTIASGVPNTPLGADALDRTFTYDPLDRLLSATGRECDRLPEALPWADEPRCADVTRAHAYSEHYEYDPVGNLLRTRHQYSNGAFVSIAALVPGSNRLATLTHGTGAAAPGFAYEHDASGNVVRENVDRHFHWDHQDRLRAFRVQTGEAEPSVYAQYFYDASGQRVMKLVRRQGGAVERTIYIDGAFEERRFVHATSTAVQDTLHVIDDQTRVALIRVGDPFPGDPGPAVRFDLGDHLGNSTIVLDDTGASLTREEYAPYGGCTFGSFARKRYRFLGKERDEESSLYYCGARYYAPWLARWLSCDPAGMADGLNVYRYSRNNPMRFIDPTGRQSSDSTVSVSMTLTTSETSADQRRTSVHLQSVASVGSCGTLTISSQGESTTPSSKGKRTSESLGSTLGAGGAGLAAASPTGFTLSVPDSYSPEKLQAYRKGTLRGEIGRNAGTGQSTKARRNAPEQRAARAEHRQVKDGLPKETAPGGKGWAQDHLIELQHDLAGSSGASPSDYRWQDSVLNSREGAQSWALNKNNPQGTPAGAVARASEAGTWYHSPAFRGVLRSVGRATEVYGIAQSGLHVVDAVQADIEQGTIGAQTAAAVAVEAGGWGGAAVLGSQLAAAGTLCGPLAWVCTPAGGVVGGAVGYFGGSWLVEGIIDTSNRYIGQLLE